MAMAGNSDVGALPAGAPAAPGFRDPTALTKSLKVLLYVSIAVDVISLLSGGFEFQLLRDIRDGRIASASIDAAADANDTRQQVIGIVMFLLYLVTGICFLVWIHRANSNARALGAQDMKFTPGWAVGWYFIPVANLWKPYQAMKEIWQASANPAGWQSETRGAILPIWWFLFLATNVLSNVSLRLQWRAKMIEDFLLSSVASMIADVASIALDFAALTLVAGIFRLQMTQAHRGT